MQSGKKVFVLALLLIFGFAAQGFAADINFFGTARVIPTYYSNFDFDDDKSDVATLNEGGWTSGMHTRAEVRLGWKAAADKWSVMMIAEGDLIMRKDNVDRSFYVGAEKGAVPQPNAGGEFGIERAEFSYTFLPQLKLATGWNIRFLDIKSGGLLYGDDHPFIGLSGKLSDAADYQLLYIPIQNFAEVGQSLPTVDLDWRVYSAKANLKAGGMTFSPIFAFSDNRIKDADVFYYGLEGLGDLGFIKPSFEVVFADGEFGEANGDRDISSWAAFVGAEMPVSKAFNPYVAIRYTQGDDDASDDDVEGWVGITDIGRFTPLMGMDGNILGEHLASGASPYGASLYAYAPERALGTNTYGGIGNAGSGNNPGQQLLAIGAKGDLSQFIPKLLYKTQAFFIWYDEEGNLTNVKNPGEEVDDYAGTTFDLNLIYGFSENFSMSYIFSTFLPGDGIEDQVDADDAATINALQLAWKY